MRTPSSSRRRWWFRKTGLGESLPYQLVAYSFIAIFFITRLMYLPWVAYCTSVIMNATFFTRVPHVALAEICELQSCAVFVGVVVSPSFVHCLARIVALTCGRWMFIRCWWHHAHYALRVVGSTYDCQRFIAVGGAVRITLVALLVQHTIANA